MSRFYSSNFNKIVVRFAIRGKKEYVTTTKLGYCFLFLEITRRWLINAYDVSYKARENHFSHRVHHFIQAIDIQE